ncbi:MAG: hypothetical protein K0Q51_1448 [Rickettsiaceae bacterium]|jgi:hypothetical protein|nr:hypothetical protein [Rickettsiaceae bacterium]
MKGQSTTASHINQPRSLINSADINGKKIILSSVDSLTLGSKKGPDSDYTAKDGAYIYAENLVISKDFKAKEAIISAHNLTIAEDVLIDISGAQGITPWAQPVSENSNDTDANPTEATDGEDSKTLSIFVETVNPDKVFNIKAIGGDGGNGKPGSYSTKGGDGRNGGKGGTVKLISGSHPYLQWINTIKSAYKIDDLVQKKKMLVDFIDNSLTTPPEELKNPIASLYNAVKSEYSSKNSIQELLKNLAEYSKQLYESWKIQQTSAIDVGGGNEGGYGEGTPNGHSGKRGDQGNIALQTIDKIENFKNLNILHIHPTQCTMTLNKAKLKYMFLDPVKNPVDAKDLIILLKRLDERTKPFVDLDPKLKIDSELIKYWKNNESIIGATNSIDAFAMVNQETNGYLTNIRNGNDFFGYLSTYVPLISINLIEKNGVKNLLDNFKVIDDSYRDYFSQLQKEELAIEQVKTIRESANNFLTQSNFDILALKDRLTSSARLIQEYDSLALAKKEMVQTNIEKYLNAVQNYFEFDIEKLLSAFSTIAFAPDSELMWITQAAQFGYNGATNVKNLEGRDIKKEYIIHKITTAGANLKSISEGFKSDKDGSILVDDFSGTLIIAQQQQIESQLDEFYGKFPFQAQDLKDAMRGYVDILTARNSEILKYNSYISVINQDLQTRSDMNQQISDLNDQQLDELHNNIPALASFISNAYYMVRNNIIHIMDLAARANKLWTLTNENILTASIGNTDIIDVDYAFLNNIQQDFWYKYTLNIIDKGPAGSPFKDITYQISDKTSLHSLKTYYKVDVTIHPQFHGDSGSFGQMAEIRIAHARPYLNNAKTDNGKLVLSITHGSDEKFVSKNNQKFDFIHPHYTMPFKYNLNDRSDINVDPDFSINVSADESKNLQPIMSPFTTWTIAIDPIDNPGLEISGVDRIDLVFDGICSGFAS